MAVSTATNTLQEKIERQKGEIERKHGKTVDQLRSEREKLIYDAITLKTPDRVPVTIQTGVFACRYAGLPLSAMYYDQTAYWEACIKVIVDFDPDTGGKPPSRRSGR